ncbi:MAG: thioredoxin domain-containing protein [Bdellovibrionales bacterium]|nr:thioredoxin domain-containing protein [Bdellovibrionales bacterium]
MTKRNSQIISLLVAFVSFCIYVYLTRNHYSLVYGMSEGKSLCNISSYLNCDAVDASPYSRIFGVPIALLGALTHIVLILSILAGWSDNAAKAPLWRKASLLLAIFIATMSVVMGVITITKIAALCIFCLTLYILSFLQLFFVLKTTEPKERELNADFFRSVFRSGPEGLSWFAIFLVAIPALGFLGHDMAKTNVSKSMGGFNADNFVNEWKQNTPHDFSSGGGLVMGPAADQAKMTIVEFADFLCGHCKHAAPALHSFVSGHSDIRFVFMTFPLDGQCNKALTQSRGGQSCDLAKAALCAEEQGKGWKTHEYLFENATPEGLKVDETVASVGLDKAAFETCLKSTDTHLKIEKMADLGKAAGIQGTPTIFVNGKLLPAGQIRAVLDATYQSLQ